MTVTTMTTITTMTITTPTTNSELSCATQGLGDWQQASPLLFDWRDVFVCLVSFVNCYHYLFIVIIIVYYCCLFMIIVCLFSCSFIIIFIVCLLVVCLLNYRCFFLKQTKTSHKFAWFRLGALSLAL